jgi:hypothetical protein
MMEIFLYHNERTLIRIAASLLLVTWLWAESTIERPYPGITHITRTEDFPRKVHLHVVQVNLGAAGIGFKLTPASGSRETVRQTTLDFLLQEGAQVAVNSHFFVPFPSTDTESWLVGLAASNGNVYSAFEDPQQNYAIAARAPAINIDRAGAARLVHYDPRFEDGKHVQEPVGLWNAVSGSAQVVTEGATTIPRYRTAELAGILEPGGPGRYSNGKSWYEIANARTLIGLSRDNQTLTFLTVDRAGGSLGLKVSEAADLLVSDYAVYQALNLDGGGSTTLAIGGRVVNTPAEGGQARAVGSSIAVFAGGR